MTFVLVAGCVRVPSFVCVCVYVLLAGGQAHVCEGDGYVTLEPYRTETQSAPVQALRPLTPPSRPQCLLILALNDFIILLDKCLHQGSPFGHRFSFFVLFSVCLFVKAHQHNSGGVGRKGAPSHGRIIPRSGNGVAFSAHTYTHTHTDTHLLDCVSTLNVLYGWTANSAVWTYDNGMEYDPQSTPATSP